MHKLLKAVASYFIKYECMSCNTAVPSKKALCFECNRQIGLIDQTSACIKCGRYCLAQTCYFCIQSTPAFTMAKAFCTYNEHSASVIKSFKYHGNKLCFSFIASKMTLLLKTMPLCDVITPVPMNSFREYIKTYNHAGKLTKVLAQNSTATFMPFLLKRRFSWKRQAVSTKQERLKNISGVFSCKHNITGKSIMLIDDAITTGATVNECARVLFNAGAKSVFVLTFAKSIKDEQIS